MTSKHTTLMDGRVKLIQSLDGLRASMDSVLLASAVTAKVNESVLDMGCGTGSVGLCVNERLKDLNLSITGIDIQEKMILLAKDNAQANGIGGHTNYLCGDVENKTLFDAETYNHIVMNPPYYKDGERQQSPDTVREKAYSGDLDIWFSSALYWVKHEGSLTLIHRADKLDDILNLAKGKFGAIEIWPIYSKPDEPAIRVVVKMIRNRKTPLRLHSPVVLFNSDGKPSKRSESILRDAKGLV